MADHNFRKNLVELVRGGSAHVGNEKVLKTVSPQARNMRPVGMEHSAFQILEHMRLAQEDILRYTLDPNWVSPPFPEGLWNKNPEAMTDADWDKSVSQFFADLNELIALIENPEIDLTAEIPHGEGRTYLREILLVADHNAYHLGQLVQVLKALGSWSG